MIYSKVGLAHLGMANETHLPYQKKSLISISQRMIANHQITYFTVDIYFKNWEGPRRPEFIPHLDMNRFTSDQKWQLYCLERFLNMYESF